LLSGWHDAGLRLVLLEACLWLHAGLWLILLEACLWLLAGLRLILLEACLWLNARLRLVLLEACLWLNAGLRLVLLEVCLWLHAGLRLILLVLSERRLHLHAWHRSTGHRLASHWLHAKGSAACRLHGLEFWHACLELLLRHLPAGLSDDRIASLWSRRDRDGLAGKERLLGHHGLVLSLINNAWRFVPRSPVFCGLNDLGVVRGRVKLDRVSLDCLHWVFCQ
jgi:hypothetical protein